MLALVGGGEECGPGGRRGGVWTWWEEGRSVDLVGGGEECGPGGRRGGVWTWWEEGRSVDLVGGGEECGPGGRRGGVWTWWEEGRSVDLVLVLCMDDDGMSHCNILYHRKLGKCSSLTAR